MREGSLNGVIGKEGSRLHTLVPGTPCQPILCCKQGWVDAEGMDGEDCLRAGV